MFSQTTLAISTLPMATGICFAQQPAASKPELKELPIKRTSASSGKPSQRGPQVRE